MQYEHKSYQHGRNIVTHESLHFFLSNQTIVLTALFILIAYAKHRIYPIKKELLWYIFIFLGGPAVEIILVNFSRAWSYANPQFFGIPLWIPFYWGVMGTTLVVLYEALTNSSKNN